MLSLYWKIFLSFWLATILIIFTTAWVTSEIAQKSSIPAREQIFMDSYANAAVATFESGQHNALKKWLKQIGESKKMMLYLLSNTGEIIGYQAPPDVIKKISSDLVNAQLDDGMLKFGNLIVSHEIISTSKNIYRLAAVSEKPLSHFVVIPWAGLTIRLTIAIFISGLICYLLSIYLTRPLRTLRMAAKSIARGELSTRVGAFKGHKRDEIAELSGEFDRMAEKLETLINSKERLLQDISHELRSPLTRLQIAIELGKKKSITLANNEFRRMEIECIRLNKLIGEILQFARLDKSVDELNKQPINILNLIKKIIDDANYEYSSSSRVILETTLSIDLALDERLIHRAIENVVRNALHYSPNNRLVKISLYINNEPFSSTFSNKTSTDTQSDATKKLSLSEECHRTNLIIDIEDDGPGVPEEHLENIFNPFYRVDPSREKKTGGYGLGLAIAQKSIFLHHGYISASNRISGGLLIRISLPLN